MLSKQQVPVLLHQIQARIPEVLLSDEGLQSLVGFDFKLRVEFLENQRLGLIQHHNYLEQLLFREVIAMLAHQPHDCLDEQPTELICISFKHLLYIFFVKNWVVLG